MLSSFAPPRVTSTILAADWCIKTLPITDVCLDDSVSRQSAELHRTFEKHLKLASSPEKSTLNKHYLLPEHAAPVVFCIRFDGHHWVLLRITDVRQEERQFFILDSSRLTHRTKDLSTVAR